MSAVSRQDLVQYCNRFLQINSFKDYCPNGLQVEGKPIIERLVTGVTASQDLLDAAIEAKADAILVHHGYFWRSDPAVITGMRKQRIETLLKHQINLLAYHLPLDAHSELGNNVQLAKQLGIDLEGVVGHGHAKNMLFYGKLPSTLAVEDFAKQLENVLKHKPMVVQSTGDAVLRVAWCTGAAQHYITDAVELGVDAFISGEISENTTHAAKELGIHYFAAGHHATERYGVQALGEHLVQEFGVSHQFIDIPNPV